MWAESDGLYVQPYPGALGAHARSTTRISRDALVFGLQAPRDGVWVDQPGEVTFHPISREEFAALLAEGQRFRAEAANPALIQQRWGVLAQLPGHTWVSESIGFGGLAGLGGGFKFPEYRRYDWKHPGLWMDVSTRLPSAADENTVSSSVPLMLDAGTGRPGAYTISSSGAAVLRFVDGQGNGSETRLEPIAAGQFEERFFAISKDKAKLLTRKRFVRSDVLEAQKRERADRWTRFAMGLGVAASMVSVASGDSSPESLSTVATGLVAMTTDDPEARRAFMDKMDERTATLRARAEHSEAQLNARIDQARQQATQHQHLLLALQALLLEELPRGMSRRQLKGSRHAGLLRAMAHQRRIRARAERETEGIEQNRLSSARLARKHAQAGGKREVQLVDQHHIADRKADQHGGVRRPCARLARSRNAARGPPQDEGRARSEAHKNRCTSRSRDSCGPAPQRSPAPRR